MIKTVYDWIFNRKLRRKITVQEAVEKLYSRIEAKGNTLASYQDTLEPFKILFLNRQCSEIRPEEIGKYLLSLSVSEATRYLRFSHLKALFNVAVHISKSSNAKVWVNPCNALSVDFRKPKIKAKPLEEDIERKINNVRGRLEEKYGLIFDLGTCGLRVSEILNLTPADLIHKDHSCLLRLAPASRTFQEFVPIPVDLYENIKKFIRERKIVETDRIFQVSRQALWMVLKQKGLKPHDIRRYAADRLTKAGKPFKTIQRFLRHSSVETTDSFLKRLNIHEV
jgi:integrase/recombinase XerD